MSENTPNPQKNKKSGKAIYWVYGIIIMVLVVIQLTMFNSSSSNREISYQMFSDELVPQGLVERVVIVNNDMVEVYLTPKAVQMEKYRKYATHTNFMGESTANMQFKIVSAEKFEEYLKDKKIAYKTDSRGQWVNTLVSWLIFIGITVALWFLLFRRVGGGGSGQIFNIGKNKATLFDQDNQVKITFADVAGLDEAKEEVQEVVEFLKNPKKFTRLGGKIPKGALLVGPPGTGKTLLAKAVAGEAQVPFFSLSGSDFVEMFVGVGAARVRDLFKTAKEKAPCIIFIDEIDAVGRARGRNQILGGNDERESTLNQLLVEMDGFGTDSGIIIMAATNRADVLDTALLRPGRFDRQIPVELPDIKGRKAIFEVHLKKIKYDPNLDVDFLAAQTPGFSGADIANICNEAALFAARKDKEIVDKQDFLDAIDRIIGGLEKKNKVISAEEKKVIAYHEAGHALVSWFKPYANPLVKVTIVPRGNALGAAWYLPEEKVIMTTEQITDELCAIMGGRASEEIIFGRISTGALSDLERVTKRSYAMVAMYGLNKRIGNVSYYDSTGQSDYTFQKPYSEKTAQLIDEEVKAIAEEAYLEAKRLIREHIEGLHTIAKQLLEKEVIFKEDVERILGPRPKPENYTAVVS